MAPPSLISPPHTRKQHTSIRIHGCSILGLSFPTSSCTVSSSILGLSPRKEAEHRKLLHPNPWLLFPWSLLHHGKKQLHCELLLPRSLLHHGKKQHTASSSIRIHGAPIRIKPPPGMRSNCAPWASAAATTASALASPTPAPPSCPSIPLRNRWWISVISNQGRGADRWMCGDGPEQSKREKRGEEGALGQAMALVVERGDGELGGGEKDESSNGEPGGGGVDECGDGELLLTSALPQPALSRAELAMARRGRRCPCLRYCGRHRQVPEDSTTNEGSYRHCRSRLIPALPPRTTIKMGPREYNTPRLGSTFLFS